MNEEGNPGEGNPGEGWFGRPPTHPQGSQRGGVLLWKQANPRRIGFLEQGRLTQEELEVILKEGITGCYG